MSCNRFKLVLSPAAFSAECGLMAFPLRSVRIADTPTSFLLSIDSSRNSISEFIFVPSYGQRVAVVIIDEVTHNRRSVRDMNLLARVVGRRFRENHPSFARAVCMHVVKLGFPA